MSDQNTQEMDFAAMAAPAEQHELLKKFEGTFKSEVRMWFEPGGEPHVSTGTMVNELDLGGRFLKQTYTGDPNEGPFPAFEGRGYFGFNKTTNEFEGFWIDNAVTSMSTEQGRVNADCTRWEMHTDMQCPMSGEPMKRRSVCIWKDADHHVMEMYHTAEGHPETKSMEIRYERA
ncbi:MAG: DUF1579 family protein [Planctomycetota bacterium]